MKFGERGPSILDGLPDPAWMIDGAGVLVAFNAAFAGFIRAMGREAAAAIPFRELVAGTDREELWRDLVTRVLGGRMVAADARFVSGGNERAYMIHGTPTRDGSFFFAREVTVHHALREDSLELALTRLFATEPTLDAALARAIAFVCTSEEWDAAVAWILDGNDELAPHAIWIRESVPYADGLRRTIATMRFARGHGLPGRAWATNDIIWVPDLRDETGLLRARVAAKSGLHTIVAVPVSDSNRQPIGVVELFDRAVRPVSSARKQSLGRVATAIAHLVDRRRAEDERRRLVELVEQKGKEWALTFDAIRQPIFLTSRDGTILRMNRAARDLAAASHYADLLGRRIGAIADAEPWRTLGDLVTAVAESGEGCTAHFEDDEAVFDAEASLDAEKERVVVTLRDTTEVVRLQESVRRGEQLAALGELVAGVAHQVKNPLFGMRMSIDLLQEQVGPDPESRELFDALQTWLHRLDRLMESLLAYGKTWTVDLRPHALKDVVEQAIEICRPVAEANGVPIVFESRGDAMVLMDPQRLVHAFENVITNAAQHSPRDCRVEVTLAIDVDAAEVSVRDYGDGFRLEDLPRIFEPFFTRRRGGTGLGLSVVQRVVDEHGGTVTAENAATESGGGAVVNIRIPLYDERSPAGTHAADSHRR